MQSIDPFEQFVQSYESEIVKREACLEIQQKLEHFCKKLADLQKELQRVNTPAEDDRYQQLEARVRHYRYQLNYELPKLAENLLENRQAHPQETIDWIGQIIEERRQHWPPLLHMWAKCPFFLQILQLRSFFGYFAKR